MDTSNSQFLKQEGIEEHSSEKSGNYFGNVAFNLVGYRYEGGPRWLCRRRDYAGSTATAENALEIDVKLTTR